MSKIFNPLRLRWILLIFLAILTASVIIIISKDDYYIKDEQFRRLLEKVFVPLILGITGSFLILFSGYRRLLKDLEQIERDKESRKLRRFWNHNDSSFKYTICYGKDGGHYVDNNSMQVRSSRPTVESLVLIKQTLRNIYHIEKVTIEEIQLTPENRQRLKEGNIIILGGPLSINGMQDFSEDLDLPFKYNSGMEERTISTSDIDLKSIANNGHITSDYASVTRVFDSDKNRVIFWFSGNYGLGTFASVLYFTNNSFLLSMNQSDLHLGKGFGSEFMIQQFIVKVDNINNNRIDMDHRNISISYVKIKEESPEIQRAISRFLLG
jgi:hypothetical protein